MSKAAEVFTLDVKQGGNGLGETFEVPDHLTTDGMTVQVTGTFTETVGFQGGLSAGDLASLVISGLWQNASGQGTSGSFTAGGKNKFIGGDFTHLATNVSSWVSDGAVVKVLLPPRPRPRTY